MQPVLDWAVRQQDALQDLGHFHFEQLQRGTMQQHTHQRVRAKQHTAQPCLRAYRQVLPHYNTMPPQGVMAACKELLWQCEPRQIRRNLLPYRNLLGQQGWTRLITECGKLGEPNKAWEIFRAVPDKNIWHYSALISALGLCGHWNAAMDVLQYLKAVSAKGLQLQPNHVTYSAAIVACARGRRLDLVQHLFAEMQHAGLIPDEVTLHIMLSTYARIGQWQQLDALLKVMHERGECARPVIYHRYIQHLCSTQQWNYALTIFQVMQDLGSEVDPATACDLIMALIRSGKPWMALQLLLEVEKCGEQLDSALYDMAVRALAATRHGQQAPQLTAWLDTKLEAWQQQQRHHTKPATVSTASAAEAGRSWSNDAAAKADAELLGSQASVPDSLNSAQGYEYCSSSSYGPSEASAGSTRLSLDGSSGGAHSMADFC